ncbi:MAG: hypothetical protein ACYCYR_16595 [Desulfobulbaceae bacterium]
MNIPHTIAEQCLTAFSLLSFGLSFFRLTAFSPTAFAEHPCVN